MIHGRWKTRIARQSRTSSSRGWHSMIVAGRGRSRRHPRQLLRVAGFVGCSIRQATRPTTGHTCTWVCRNGSYATPITLDKEGRDGRKLPYDQPCSIGQHQQSLSLARAASSTRSRSTNFRRAIQGQLTRRRSTQHTAHRRDRAGRGEARPVVGGGSSVRTKPVPQFTRSDGSSRTHAVAHERLSHVAPSGVSELELLGVFHQSPCPLAALELTYPVPRPLRHPAGPSWSSRIPGRRMPPPVPRRNALPDRCSLPHGGSASARGLQVHGSLNRPQAIIAASVQFAAPLRLLPAGATVAGRDSHPLGHSAFPRRTLRPG